MSFVINKTDGSVLIELADGQIDQSATDLTLVGKNALVYGEAFNENFIKLLENFANISEPSIKTVGQLWFDTSENRLKVYDGTTFKVSGGTIVSQTQPSSITQGDIWINSSTQQLYFNDGVDTLLCGPIYSTAQGKSGFQTVTVVDSSGVERIVVALFVSNALIGIFSKAAFYTSDPIFGFSGNVGIGFTVNPSSGTVFDVLSTKATSLVSANGDLKTSDSFLSTSDDSATTGSLTILNTDPLYLGTIGTVNGQVAIRVITNDLQINGTSTALQHIKFKLYDSGNIQQTAFFIDGHNKQLGVYTETPTATLDVNGSVRVRGGLIVEGTVTTVATNNLEISDKVITLAKSSSPSDANADGGGFLLQGATDKSFLWDNTYDNWNSSEHINIFTGKEFRINNALVLSSTTLGSSVVSSSLTSVGTLTSLTTAYLDFSTSTSVAGVTGTMTSSSLITTITGLSTTAGLYPGQVLSKTGGTGVFGSSPTIRNIDSTTQITVVSSTANTSGSITFTTSGPASGPLAATIKFVNANVNQGSISIIPKGTGTVDVTSSRVTSVAAPLYNNDAANKLYVDSAVQTTSLSMSLLTTGWTNSQIAILISKVFPPSEHLLASVTPSFCRVICRDEGTTQQVAAADFVFGVTYIITVVGTTTNWASIGAYTTGSVGTVFVKNSTVSSGDGYAAPYIRAFQLSGSPVPSWAFYDNL
jgi:hypothetical protein